MSQANSLHESPNLDYLKKRAKQTLKRMRVRQPKMKLAEAQRQVARESGFSSWRALRAHVLQSNSSEADAQKLFRAVYRDDVRTAREILKKDRALVRARAAGSFWDAAFAGEVFLTSAAVESSTLLHYAAVRNAPKIAELLVDQGHDLEARGYEGNLGFCTPLVLAAFAGADRIDVLRVLLARGANPNARSSAGQTALGTALGHNETEIVKTLIARGATMSIHHAAAMGDLDRIKGMLKTDPTLADARDDYDGWTPVAAGKTRTIREFLLAHGAKPDLVELCFCGMIDRIRPIIRSEPSLINLRNAKGRLPLHTAIENGHLEIVKLLLQQGADPAVEWVPGFNAMELAERRNQTAIAEYLSNFAESIDAAAIARRAVKTMQRAWAESSAIIERLFDDPGHGVQWEPAGIESPTLREHEADVHIIGRRRLGRYRMISVWHHLNADRRQLILARSFSPTRSLEFLRAKGPQSAPVQGTWRRLDWKPTREGFSGKPGRSDDLVEALTFLRDHAEPGQYRVITIRRMLLAREEDGKIKVIKKHADRKTLDRIEQSAWNGDSARR